MNTTRWLVHNNPPRNKRTEELHTHPLNAHATGVSRTHPAAIDSRLLHTNPLLHKFLIAQTAKPQSLACRNRHCKTQTRAQSTPMRSQPDPWGPCAEKHTFHEHILRNSQTVDLPQHSNYYGALQAVITPQLSGHHQAASQPHPRSSRNRQRGYQGTAGPRARERMRPG